MVSLDRSVNSQLPFTILRYIKYYVYMPVM